MEGRHLIVGLGNPGKTYANTRHNIGFRIVKAIAEKHAITFRPSLSRVKGSLGEGAIGETTTLLLLPLTYMNESGQAVRKCVDYYKIEDRLMIITDDIDLPVGKIRMRMKGGSGGHNGLKSVEAHLGTKDYRRLRIGVGDREAGELADYVLGRFSQEEEKQLPDVVTESIEIIETWLSDGDSAAMHEANKKK